MSTKELLNRFFSLSEFEICRVNSETVNPETLIFPSKGIDVVAKRVRLTCHQSWDLE